MSRYGTSRPATAPIKSRYRVALKHVDRVGTVANSGTNVNKASRQDLAKLLFGVLNLTITALITTASGFICETDDTKIVDKLLDSGTDLAKLGLKCFIPHQLLALRTLLVRHIDEEIGKLSADNIVRHILQHPRNLELDLKISHVVKLPGKTRTIKIITKDNQTAETLASKGFFIGYMKIPTDHIHQEEHAAQVTCYRCYKIGEHNTRDCKQKEQSCSNCAQTGHKHTDCPRPQAAQCVNCKRSGKTYSHHTLALRCPYRKSQVKAAAKPVVARPLPAAPTKTPLLLDPIGQTTPRINPDSILSVTKDVVREQVSQVVTRELILKMAAMVLDAHISALHDEDSYEHILNTNMVKHFGTEVHITSESHDPTVEPLLPLISDAVDKAMAHPKMPADIKRRHAELPQTRRQIKMPSIEIPTRPPVPPKVVTPPAPPHTPSAPPHTPPAAASAATPFHTPQPTTPTSSSEASTPSSTREPSVRKMVLTSRTSFSDTPTSSEPRNKRERSVTPNVVAKSPSELQANKKKWIS